ncbi:lipopolysaccharide-induced tumor necrosis factor-alpha factor homolog [Drosophila tropicalis]|uniref:lipopolysaccharide-induced tumor necrosis factor-alpha factor homolog n=1 Tax=Drosophila tropicalis TaxID=46794 RepID=UPI0035ABEA44
MDQKRAMLYPQVDNATAPSAPLPTPSVMVEAPPSYDVAIAVPQIIVQPQPQALQPQQLPYQQQQQQPEPTVVHTGPLNLGPNRCRVLCPACGVEKTTRMTYTANSRTHFSAGLLCLIGWCCCACFVPYCMKSCRTGNHYCRKCNTFLGSYNPQGVK